MLIILVYGLKAISLIFLLELKEISISFKEQRRGRKRERKGKERREGKERLGMKKTSTSM